MPQAMQRFFDCTRAAPILTLSAVTAATTHSCRRFNPVRTDARVPLGTAHRRMGRLAHADRGTLW